MTCVRQPPGPVTAAILAFPEATASVMYGLNDLFHSAGRDWGMIVGGAPGPALVVPRIAAVREGPLRIANGVTVVPDAVLEDMPVPDLVCIPEILVAPMDSLAGRFDREIDWLRACYRQGSIVAAACSGALLLAEAGLLDGEDATTHWAYCDALAARFPAVRVQRQRSLVAAGEGQRLIMAGGGSSWLDLGLFLVARVAGVDAAMQLARIYLIDWHHVGQQPFARLSASRQTEDALVAKCQVWAATHYHAPAPVAAMARIAGLSERSLVRRFQKATGMTPIQYVHTIRIEEAKQMLEATQDPVEAIAQDLGYEDASFFIRLFKRSVRLTPSQYRRKFGRLREVLRSAQPAAIEQGD
ncbi:GlxA family transcriptional regulator [Thioalkalivibrio paradoxus]|uniref:GlxA family transcriptional regulator n=1 Tax=Thioalkalivibrio paradoxus TaxID=108010 RepID=UPI00022C1B85|nr:helix-turn-helix domain-containing protein [Thioalkalivibrio paradoxus]